MEREKILKKVLNGVNLTVDESRILFENILSGVFVSEEISAVLTGLRIKGETSDEIAGAILAMNSKKVVVNKNSLEAVDTCGTGGDGKDCINVSTIVSIVVAAAGIPVVKHGNSAQSGKIGSADILKEFQIPSKLKKDEAEDFLNKNNFVFLFAPLYHPGMKYVGTVRKTLGVPTIFNFLGPFSNPVDPDFQTVGINNVEKLSIIAEAVKKAGKENVVIYSSVDGYDEFSTNAPTKYFEINGGIHGGVIKPEDFFEPFDMPRVSSRDEAKELFLKAIKGESEKLTNLVAFNAAFILKKMKKLKNLKEGYEYGYEIIKSGKAFEKFQQLCNEIQ